MTMRRMATAAALAATLIGTAPAFAGDAPAGTPAAQAPPVASEATVASEPATRIDRTRPGRRQPAFGLRRLTPPPAATQPAPNRPM